MTRGDLLRLDLLMLGCRRGAWGTPPALQLCPTSSGLWLVQACLGLVHLEPSGLGLEPSGVGLERRLGLVS